MSTFERSFGEIKKAWQWYAVGAAVLLVWAAIAMPNMNRSIVSKPEPHTFDPSRATYYSPQDLVAPTASLAQHNEAKARPVQARVTSGVAERKIVRTSSIQMIVQHPAEVADKIASLADEFGGYVESSQGGGQDATAGTLTIRVPGPRFAEFWSTIHKMGLRVEGEGIDAQDVTRQYVDQEASMRNLRAEEAQYLAIMKQASTVKDMLTVSEQLSEVRGQIEQQQAEFNALSRQIETVAIAISLRAESEA
jgi:hypothetical protein